LTISLLAGAAQAHGAEPLVTVGVIDAPVADIWSIWTTKKGWESCLAAHAEVDLRVGGLIRSVHDPNATIGDDSTIENIILSYEPQRMLSFKVSKPPARFPFKTAIQQVWTVLRFESVDNAHTRLTCTMLGYGDDDESQRMRAFFERGNQCVLDKVRERFAHEEPPSDAARVLTLMKSMVGGEWIFENARGDGKVFRSRSVMDHGPDGKSLIARGWLGDASGMSYHAATQMWIEPRDAAKHSNVDAGLSANVVRFQNINQDGSIARGDIRLIGEKQVRWDWNETSISGTAHRYRVEMTFIDDDHYRYVLFDAPDADEGKQLVDVTYQRVTETPERFKTLRARP
jgi:uncharacterized protein YndB with AHSA1/START domain